MITHIHGSTHVCADITGIFKPDLKKNKNAFLKICISVVTF
jgi:hypothetical protein